MAGGPPSEAGGGRLNAGAMGLYLGRFSKYSARCLALSTWSAITRRRHASASVLSPQLSGSFQFFRVYLDFVFGLLALVERFCGLTTATAVTHLNKEEHRER